MVSFRTAFVTPEVDWNCCQWSLL